MGRSRGRAKGVGDRGCDTGNMECGVDSVHGGRQFYVNSSGTDNSGDAQGANKTGCQFMGINANAGLKLVAASACASCDYNAAQKPQQKEPPPPPDLGIMEVDILYNTQRGQTR